MPSRQRRSQLRNADHVHQTYLWNETEFNAIHLDPDPDTVYRSSNRINFTFDILSLDCVVSNPAWLVQWLSSFEEDTPM